MGPAGSEGASPSDASTGRAAVRGGDHSRDPVAEGGRFPQGAADTIGSWS